MAGDATPTATKYKVLYFNYMWIAEPIRYLLSYVGEPFEDARLDWEEWEKGTNPDMKKGHPYGRLPYLEETLANGEIFRLSQSFTVSRYLARKYNLCGSSLHEEMKCDEYTDCIKDILKSVEQLWTDNEAEKTKQLKYLHEKCFPGYLSCIEADLERKRSETENEFIPLVGNTVTWADILCAHYTELFDLFLEKECKQTGSILDNYPLLRAHQKGVMNLDKIKAWREKRPVTPL